MQPYRNAYFALFRHCPTDYQIAEDIRLWKDVRNLITFMQFIDAMYYYDAADAWKN